MSTGYKIYNQENTYYLTFQVVDWVDIFTRKIYRDILIESFDFCRKNKGLQIWAYVIMSNHVHCILSARDGNLSALIRDFKSFTASKILKEISLCNESRKDWMLKRFEFAAKSHQRNSDYQFWNHDNHAIELITHDFTCQKLAYIHLNPVRSGLVENDVDWLYSSARNYADMNHLLDIDVMDL